MTYKGRITQQGQISIPSEIRQMLGFSQPGDVIMRVVDDKLIVEPIKDLKSLAGILHDRAKFPKGYKKLSQQEIINLEKEAAIKGHIQRYEKSLR